MTEITVHELYELYLDTLGRCTPALRSQSDEELVYNLSEEFDIGVRSFLHEESLAKLREAGLIDDEMVEASKDIRRRWLSLVDRAWTVEEIKSNDAWNEMFALCNSLKLKATQKHLE